MTDKDKKIIRDLVIKVRGYYDGIDERLTDALKAILRRLDKPDHVLDIDVVKIRGLLEKARKQILHNHAGGDYVGSGFAEEDCDKFIVKALTLLPEPCPTCGGSKEVRPKHIRSAHEALPYMIPCPKCQSQEPKNGWSVETMSKAETIEALRSQGQCLCETHNDNFGQGVCERAIDFLRKPESQEPAEKQDEDCAMWSMVGTKVYKKCAQVYKLEAKLEAANKRAEAAEADNEAIGQRYEGLEQHYNRALQTGKQLTAKLAEANGVNEMLKEKGIG